MAKAKAKASKTRSFKPCARPECGLAHAPVAACADGFRKQVPFHRASSSSAIAPAAPEATPVLAEAMPAAEVKPDLALITDPDELEKYMPRDLAEELVRRREDERVEKDWRQAQDDLGVPLVKPMRLRKKSPAAADALLGQLDAVINQAKTQAPSIPLAREAQVVHDTLVRIPQQRQDEETAAKDAAAPKPHLPGSTDWLCTACNRSFTAASREMVQRKSRAEPEWQFRCPICQSPKVRLNEAA